MSFVIAAPDLVQGAANDLAGIRASLAEAAAMVAAPTTGVMPAAADEVSAAISALFGNFGQQFQVLSAQAQAFHGEFVSLLNAGAGAYLNTEIANAEQAAMNAIGGAGSVGSAGATPGAAASLLDGLLGGGSSSGGGLLGGLTGGTTGGTSGVGGLLGGLTGGTSGVGGLLGGLTGGTSGVGGLLGGLTGGTSGVGGLLGGLTGGTSGVGGLLGGLTGPSGLGGLLSGLTGGTSGLGGMTHTGPFGGIFAPFFRELHAIEQAVVHAIGGSAAAAAATSGAGGLLGGLLGGTSSGGGLLGGLTGSTSGLGGLVGGLTGGSGGLGGLLGGLAPTVNSLLPGLLNLQVGGSMGTGFTGILGPYEALFANTANNLQSLTAGWLADPFPFLRQIGANWAGYGQIAATALTTGNLQLLSTIPADISHNVGNVFATLTNTSITPVLGVSLVPLQVTLDTLVGLPLVAGIDLIGAPVATFEAASFSFGAFSTALATGNVGGAFAAAIDAPAVIANGFLNGQATLPVSLSVPVLGTIADVALSLPLDGILHPPGFYAATVTVGALGLPPITVDVGLGSTPFSGLAPFIVNYAPQQLALAIGAPANPPPLIDIPLLTI